MNVYIMVGPMSFTTAGKSYAFASTGAVNVRPAASITPFIFPRSRHYVRR
jgi:hypothetical protein